ncbi:MAG: RnfABCDGE type electron transport complex subunit B [Bacteroides sp.]
MNTILFTLAVLVGIGLLAAVLLYVVSQVFKVEEDPRIDEVESTLPGANCGGCGFPGCRGFADAYVKAGEDDLGRFFCPVGGNAVMAKVAAVMGRTAEAKAPMLAVIRCAGTPKVRASIANYGGASSCRVSNNLFNGDTGCSWGCLGLGDCVTVCDFDAIHMDAERHLPVVDQDKCTACGACVKICPKHVIELRTKNVKDRRIFVSCINQEKGGVAKKACGVACIGCARCQKECPFDAIVVENNLAYIDFRKCKLCRKCVAVCPTGAIWEVNFPPRVVKSEEAKPAATSTSAQPAEAPKEGSAVTTEKKQETNA